MTGVPFTCNLDCGGGCPLLAIVEDGKVTKGIDNPEAGEYIKGCIRRYQANRIQNAVTSTKPTFPSHGSETHTVLVQVEKA